MKRAFLVLALVCSAMAGDYFVKINPAWVCTGLDSFTVHITGSNGLDTSVTVHPPIGAMPCVKVDFNQRAEEKVGAVCDSLGDVKAAIVGRYPVVDTVQTQDEKGITILTTEKRWATDENTKPVKRIVEPIAEELEAVER
jgi:hypothetical protein